MFTGMVGELSIRYIAQATGKLATIAAEAMMPILNQY